MYFKDRFFYVQNTSVDPDPQFPQLLKLWDTDLAGLWILGSIHWAGGISGNKRGVLLTAVSST